jgi:hypothetical protein
MADINTLFAAATTVSVNILVRGLPYRIMYDENIVTADSVRLILKLRADPRIIFVKMPPYDAHLFTDSQISRINNEELFVQLSYWGRTDSGDSIIQMRNAALPMSTSSEMLAAGAVGN